MSFGNTERLTLDLGRYLYILTTSLFYIYSLFSKYLKLVNGLYAYLTILSPHVHTHKLVQPTLIYSSFIMCLDI